MPAASPRLLNRLRRHRGVWLLALAVLLFKVGMSTFCILDGPGPVTTLIGDAPGISASIDNDGDHCVLNEGKGCHCACAHTVAMPATILPVVAAIPASQPPAAIPVAPSPHFQRSPLRPPIA
ncbi:hypothetical protein KR767_15995 [Luteibacter anthropi]|uniref:hypothetical protein n=1 Tax=Luteibacter anthropi TaxID=564369 RepID=UPI0020331096|nr:hypothetical protein [Luteibacter anthropi]URX61553.1 hypothetical protein KR767_15995 [Luteibacter anthropi]